MSLSSYTHLVKEWHPTKNGDLTPDDFTHATRRKVWWLCSEGHSFETEVRNRTRQKYQRGDCFWIKNLKDLCSFTIVMTFLRELCVVIFWKRGAHTAQGSEKKDLGAFVLVVVGCFSLSLAVTSIG